MDERVRQLDWALLQTFLAVAEEGSLSAAARVLGASQPTLGRQVKTIEETLGAPVFARHARGLGLTDFGEMIMPAARAMQSAANDIRVAAATRETDMAGNVRLTASRTTSYASLPAILAGARQRYPNISLDLVPSDDTENLIYGEADIAVRMFRPTQLDLITRFIGDISFGLFASRAYLDRVGRPRSIDDVLTLDLIGYDRDRRLIDGMTQYGVPAARDMFATRCDDPVVQWELLINGCGATFFQSNFARRDSRVEEIPLPMDLPTLPVWLTTSAAMRQTPRIRAIWDVLVEDLPARI